MGHNMNSAQMQTLVELIVNNFRNYVRCADQIPEDVTAWGIRQYLLVKSYVGGNAGATKILENLREETDEEYNALVTLSESWRAHSKIHSWKYVLGKLAAAPDSAVTEAIEIAKPQLGLLVEEFEFSRERYLQKNRYPII